MSTEWSQDIACCWDNRPAKRLDGKGEEKEAIKYDSELQNES